MGRLTSNKPFSVTADLDYDHIQECLTEYLPLHDMSSCQNFVSSAALAEICSLQVCLVYYAPPLIGGGIKRCFCLTSDVCLSRKSGVSREQRPRRTKIHTEVDNVTRTPLSRSKGQDHQAALVGCTGRPTWTHSSGDICICVHDVYHRVTICRSGWGHIMVTARLQLV